MKNLFIPCELAKLAKEKGFNELCFSYYHLDGTLSENPKENGDDLKYQGDIKFDQHQNSYTEHDELCSAPLYQQLVDWFREKYKIDVRVFPMYATEGDYETCWGWNLTELEWGTEKEHHIANAVGTRKYGLDYYQVLSKAIEEAFKLI